MKVITGYDYNYTGCENGDYDYRLWLPNACHQTNIEETKLIKVITVHNVNELIL